MTRRLYGHSEHCMCCLKLGTWIQCLASAFTLVLKLEGIFMNKSELIDSIAEKSGLNKTQAGDALNAVMDSIGDALEAGDSISLVGFGTFSVKDRKARTGRNPKTGEELNIPASKVPSFKAGKNLKERLN